MEIRCKYSKAFLLNINIEEYINELENLGISQQTPLKIEIPCKKCKMIENYDIYKDRYILTKSYKKVIKV